MLFVAGFRNAGFLTGRVGFAMALTAFEVSLAFRTPLEGVGVGVLLAAFFPKKLWIVRCPDEGPALEFCLCNDAGARAGVADPSFAFPISTIQENREFIVQYKQEGRTIGRGIAM